jgi:hypothetical protein
MYQRPLGLPSMGYEDPTAEPSAVDNFITVNRQAVERFFVSPAFSRRRTPRATSAEAPLGLPTTNDADIPSLKQQILQSVRNHNKKRRATRKPAEAPLGLPIMNFAKESR